MANNNYPPGLTNFLRSEIGQNRARFNFEKGVVEVPRVFGAGTPQADTVYFRFMPGGNYIAREGHSLWDEAEIAQQFYNLSPEIGDSIVEGGRAYSTANVVDAYHGGSDVPANAQGPFMAEPKRRETDYTPAGAALRLAGTTGGLIGGSYALHRSALLPYLKYNAYTGLSLLSSNNLKGIFTPGEKLNNAIDIAQRPQLSVFSSLPKRRLHNLQTFLDRTGGKHDFATMKPTAVTPGHGFLTPRAYGQHLFRRPSIMSAESLKAGLIPKKAAGKVLKKVVESTPVGMGISFLLGAQTAQGGVTPQGAERIRQNEQRENIANYNTTVRSVMNLPTQAEMERRALQLSRGDMKAANAITNDAMQIAREQGRVFGVDRNQAVLRPAPPKFRPQSRR